jgi:acetone carboxylase alpha subunit
VKGSNLVNVTLSASGAHNGGIFHKGLFGGYPAPGWKCLWVKGASLQKIVAAHGKVPASINEAATMLKDGTLPAEDYYCGPLNTWSPNLTDGDLFGVNYNGGCGYGDPLERERAAIEKDLFNGLISEAMARKVYGYAKTEQQTVALRERMRRQRLAESVPAGEWWRRERRRAAKGDIGAIAAQTFARSAALSDKIKERWLEFWELERFPYTDTGRVDFKAIAPTGFYYPKSAQRPKTAPARRRRAGKKPA